MSDSNIIRDSSEKTYTIQQMSQYSGWSHSTLRYYEEIGLLPNVIHLDNGRRLYTDWHIRRVDGIQCFKKTNMSVQEILTFFSLEASDVEHNIDTLVHMLDVHRNNVRAQIAELEKNLRHVEHKFRHYSKMKKSIEEGTPLPIWVPEE